MEVRVQPFDESLYPVVKGWWEGHGQEPVPIKVLPKLGGITYYDDTPVVAAWVVMSNSNGVAYLEWLVSNPKERVVLTGFRYLWEYLSRVLKENDYSVVFASFKDPRLANYSERFGFFGNEVMTHKTVIL